MLVPCDLQRIPHGIGVRRSGCIRGRNQMVFCGGAPLICTVSPSYAPQDMFCCNRPLLCEPFANNREPFANLASLTRKAIPRGPTLAGTRHTASPDKGCEKTLHHSGAGRVLEPLADLFDSGLS